MRPGRKTGQGAPEERCGRGGKAGPCAGFWSKNSGNGPRAFVGSPSSSHDNPGNSQFSPFLLFTGAQPPRPAGPPRPARGSPPGGAQVGGTRLAAQALGLLNAGKIKEAADAYASIIKQFPTAGADAGSALPARLRAVRARAIIARPGPARAHPGPARRSGDQDGGRICCRRRSWPPRPPRCLPDDPRRAAAFQNAIAQYDAFLQKYPRSPNVESGQLRPGPRRLPDPGLRGAAKGLRDNLTRFPASASILDSEDLLALVLSAQASDIAARRTATKRRPLPSSMQALQIPGRDIVQRHPTWRWPTARNSRSAKSCSTGRFRERRTAAPRCWATPSKPTGPCSRRNAMMQAQKARLGVIAQHIQAAALVRNQAEMKRLQSGAGPGKRQAGGARPGAGPDSHRPAPHRGLLCLLQKFDEARVLLQLPRALRCRIRSQRSKSSFT